MTSGSPGIDYFVSSELFETAASIDGREVRRIAGTASDISAATGAGAAADYENDVANARPTPSGGSLGRTDTATLNDDRVYFGGNLPRTGTQPVLQAKKKHENNGSHQWQRRGGDAAQQDYTEQLVLFDSLTASLLGEVDPVNTPTSAVTAVLGAVRASSPTSVALEELLQGGDNLYHCIQHSKKFHPDFDPVLRGVLESDPAAKILLSAASEVSSSPNNHIGVRLDLSALLRHWRKH